MKKEDSTSKLTNILLIILVLLMFTGTIQNYNLSNRVNKVLQVVEGETINAPKRLYLKGVYGDNQSYHPKVLSFEENWNGYKYWMSFTPYPYSQSDKENPHVVVSNDRINWKTKKDFSNPLDEVEDTANGKRYNSDSHLVYNQDTNQLECWWRYVDDVDNKVVIYRKTTKDGIIWSDKEEIFVSNNRKKTDYISPAIIYEEGIYKIWYVNKNRVMYIESADLKTWSKAKDMEIIYEDSVLSWHLDVIHTEKGYEMILVAYSDWNHRMYMNLYYTKSIDNEKWEKAEVIMKPTTGTNYWDNSGLYRSSFIYENGKYYVFYSGQGTDKAKGIGLMEGTDIFHLTAVDY